MNAPDSGSTVGSSDSARSAKHAEAGSPRVAEQVTVVTDEGNRYPGWVVLPDVVLVRALRRVDFCPSVRVERRGHVHAVVDRLDSVAGTPPNRRGVALVLAPGSIEVPGGAASPTGVEATGLEWRRQFIGLEP